MNADPNEITYVITVHGIGEQRLNETLLPVVSRFAEARRANAAPPRIKRGSRDVLTLGLASGQTGVYQYPQVPNKIHLQFEDLPQSPVAKLPPFYGLPQKSSSGNLRFLDIHWADLLDDGYQQAGQPPDRWVESLVGRLQAKNADKKHRIPPSSMQLLYTLEQSLDLLYRILKLRNKTVTDLAFGKYLGDVQAYTEYGYCRGQAVRRFHDLMERLHTSHLIESDTSDKKPRYVIIAHSLGSVLALDSIMYACARQEIREATPECFPEVNSFPLYGYLNGEPVPTCDWVRSVDSLVTLGSPITKIMTIWWYNYAYLAQPDDWLDKSKLRGASRGTVSCPEALKEMSGICHYNYADEQDPVGESLKLLYQSCAYQRIFSTEHEAIFNRYYVPLAAHVQYWKDFELFQWILDRTVDRGVAQVPEPDWMIRKSYAKVLAISYFVIPILILLMVAYTLIKALTASDWSAAVSAGITFVVACWLGRKMTELFVFWRQVVKAK